MTVFVSNFSGNKHESTADLLSFQLISPRQAAMYLTQEKPYRPLLVALMFLTLPLAMILHNIVQIAFSNGQGLLVRFKDGAWAVQCGW